MAKQIKPEEDITTAQEPATTTATAPNETKSQTETKDPVSYTHLTLPTKLEV